MPSNLVAGFPYACCQPSQIRCTKRRHYTYAATIGNRLGKRFDLGGRLDDAQPVAEPRDDGAANEHSAFERVFKPSAEIPSNRREQSILRVDRLRSGIHQQEAASA